MQPNYPDVQAMFDTHHPRSQAPSVFSPMNLPWGGLYPNYPYVRQRKIAAHNLSIPSNSTDTSVKVFFGNLAPVTTEGEMEDLFRLYGRCSGLIILKDRKMRPRGAGFVTFTTIEEARNAINHLDRKITLRGAHKPLEVRFPETRSEKLDRIYQLKQAREKRVLLTHRRMKHSVSSSQVISSSSELMKVSMLNARNCTNCGSEQPLGFFCLDCEQRVYVRATQREMENNSKIHQPDQFSEATTTSRHDDLAPISDFYDFEN